MLFLFIAVIMYEALRHDWYRPKIISLGSIWAIERFFAWASVVLALVASVLAVIALTRYGGRAELIGILACLIYGALLLLAVKFL